MTYNTCARSVLFSFLLSVPLALSAQDDASPWDDVEAAPAETTDAIPVESTGDTAPPPVDQIEDATQLDALEITGSRIKRTDYETAQPIAVVTRADIERTGLTNIGDILQRIPAAGSALNRNFNNGGNGQTEIDLRNLGSHRVLVLVNGHRWVAGTSLADSSVDLNTIPVSVIDRIEVLKDGASAIYGSDAITGVVNIITRRDFQGVEFGGQVQAFDDGKGQSTQTNLSLGTVSGKTSMFVDFNFVRQQALLAGDRAQSRVPKFNTNIVTSGNNFTDQFVFTRGSVIPPEGYFIFVPNGDVLNAMHSNPDYAGPNSAGEKCPVLVPGQGLAPGAAGSGVDQGVGAIEGGAGDIPDEDLPGVNLCIISPIRGETISAVNAGGSDTLATAANKFRYNGSLFGEPDPYQHNYAPVNYLLTPFEQDSIFTQINHSFTDQINMGTQILYTISRSDQQLAHEPLRIGDLFPPPFGQAYIARDNIYNPLGQDIGRGDPGSGLVGFGTVVRRMVEAGFRVANREARTLFIKNQIAGTFDLADKFVGYDVGYSYGETRRVIDVSGTFNMERVRDALGPTTSGDGFTGCPSIDNPHCVPLDLFGPPGSITQEMLDYIMYDATETNTSNIHDVFFNLSTEFDELTDLFPNDFMSRPIGVAVGGEYRSDEFSEIPDPFTTAGVSSGLNGAATKGRQNVAEGYLEMAIPIASDKFLMNELDLSLAGRYTRYNLYDPKMTGKAGIRWKPIDDLLVRTTYSQSFRAPNLQELYLGATDSFPSVPDPCEYTDPATGQQAPRPSGTDVDQNCDAEGVDDEPPSPSQLYTVFEGNRDLFPETANTFTAGFVWSPEQVRDLNIYIDYWSIQLKDAIGFVGPGLILAVCYERDPNTARPDEFCDKVERNPDTGAITRISASPVNFGATETQGIDVNFDYILPLGDWVAGADKWGQFKFLLDSQYLLEYTQSTASGEQSEDLSGKDFGDIPLPNIKFNTTLEWTLNQFSAAWTSRFLEGTTEFCDDGFSPSLRDLGLCSNPDPDLTDGVDDSTNEYPHIWYHNVQFGYEMPQWNARLVVGVLNVLDQDPPISYSAFANSAPATLYETFGSRQPYAKINVAF